MFYGFLRFQISGKWANLRFALNIWKQKVFQLQGGFAATCYDQGLCPWTLLEALPPDLLYRLALRALAMALLDCSPPAGGKLTKWLAVSKRLDSTVVTLLIAKTRRPHVILLNYFLTQYNLIRSGKIVGF